MNEPRVYRHSPILVFFVAAMSFLFFGAYFFSGLGFGLVLLPMLGMMILAGFFLIRVAFSKVVISDDEITVQNVFIPYALRWSEISHVSGSGYRLKLHNFDGDVVLSPSSQLPAYEDLIDQIGLKRPDLFSPVAYGEFKRSWVGMIIVGSVVTLVFGAMLAFLTFSNLKTEASLPLVFIMVFMAVALWVYFSSPQALTLQGRQLTIRYLTGETVLQVEDVVAVRFVHTRTRNGKNFFITLQLQNNRTLRISSLKGGLPLAYLVLKNWHIGFKR